MKTELFYLAMVTAFTGLLWVPYILDRLAVRGLMDAVGYPACAGSLGQEQIKAAGYFES